MMEAKNFLTGQYVIVDSKRRIKAEKNIHGLKEGAIYKIIRGIDAQNPGTIGIQVGSRMLNYSLFLFKPLSEEESRLAELLGGF